MKALFRFLGRSITMLRVFLTNALFVVMLVVMVIALTKDNKVAVPDKAALIVNLDGVLVEQKKAFNAGEAISKSLGGDEEPPELLVSDVVKAINAARDDERIQALVLDPQQLLPAGVDKLMTVGKAVTAFKASGKPVYAIGDYYDQHQYILASFADRIFLNPNGGTVITGLGHYRLYMKDFLAKLMITPNVYRVGTYKSAVEPFIRNDMSPEAKEAELTLLRDIWASARDQVAANRKLEPATLDLSIAKVEKTLAANQGDMAKLALDLGLVDVLAEREQMRNEIIATVGQDPEHHSFNQIWLGEYLAALPQPKSPSADSAKVGIIVARGVIMDGDQPAGNVGGDTTAWLLREARFNDEIKAVVLRIDSPGGSAFASDLIRAEIDELKKAGKPVIASMGSLAASGGYWIAAPADEIWAAPTTITGSIGIFGLITTIDRAMNHWGLNTDGVGTSDLAGAMTITRPIDPGVGQIIQHSIDHGYRKFLDLVARERGMTTEAVDKVAQGRVWTGKQAVDLGLVDKLGDLDDAVTAAAKLAMLVDYQREEITPPLSLPEQILKDLLGSAQAWLPQSARSYQQPAPLLLFGHSLMADLNQLAQWNDPQHAYAFCAACPQL